MSFTTGRNTPFIGSIVFNFPGSVIYSMNGITPNVNELYRFPINIKNIKDAVMPDKAPSFIPSE